MEVNPALVIGIGSQADDIIDRAQKLLLARMRLDSLPEIFQFLRVNPEQANETSIADAYHAAALRTAVQGLEETTDVRVDSSRVESYVIATLHHADKDAIVQVGKTLRTCAQHVAAGGRNAILLLPVKRHANDATALQSAAVALDAGIRADKCFNRCFFIDAVDELGRSITRDESVELVAKFISLALGSELSRLVRTNPPPYVGDGPYASYGSFGCASIKFDSHRLINILAGHLAHDISKKLFIESNVENGEDQWRERILSCEQSLLDKPLVNPAGIDFAGVREDLDFLGAQEKLDEFIQSVCQSAGNTLNTLQEAINSCLKEKSVRLERLRKELIGLKKKINETEIKILLGRPCDHDVESLRTEVRLKPWGLIVALAVTGIGLVSVLLIVTDFQPASYFMSGIGIGLLLLLVAIALAIVGRKSAEEFDHKIPISCERELKRLKDLYAETNKRLNIQVALFVYLDLAYANIENLRRNAITPELLSGQNSSDIYLINEDLAREFYSREYKLKGADVSAFMDGQQFLNVYRSAFSFFDSKLCDTLKTYCKQRFENLKTLNLELLFRLNEFVTHYKELEAATTPFWYPRNPAASEKMVFAIVPEQGPEQVRDFIANAFPDHNIRFVPGRVPTEAIVLQIAFGQRLDEILWSDSG